MLAVIFGRLTSEDYSDSVAADPRIDELRAKITCVESETLYVCFCLSTSLEHR